MRPGVGGADLAAERVADDVDPLVAEAHPQGLQVDHQVLEAVRHRWGRAPAVAPQVVPDAGEVFLQTG